MSPIQYLLDEHVDVRLRKAIKHLEPNIVVWLIGDPAVPAKGTLDPDILLWCESHHFSLVTNNRASMPVHLQDHLTQGQHVLGIFVLNKKMSLGDIAEELVVIWGASEMVEYMNQIVYLPISF